jgi:hypothetical protein
LALLTAAVHFSTSEAASLWAFLASSTLCFPTDSASFALSTSDVNQPYLSPRIRIAAASNAKATIAAPTGVVINAHNALPAPAIWLLRLVNADISSTPVNTLITVCP